MKRLLLICAALAAFAPFTFGDSGVTSRTAYRIRSGTALPATCSSGSTTDVFIKTDATSTQQIYVCVSGSWVQQGATAFSGGLGANTLDFTEKAAPSGAASHDLLWGDSTAHRLKMLNNNGSADTVVGAATTDALTNKTYDTAGSGNSFSINGVAVTTNTGTGSVVRANSPALVTPTGIVKNDVGLGSVDNTSDAGKPVSTAQQTALDLKAPLASPTFTGTPTAPSFTLNGTAGAGFVRFIPQSSDPATPGTGFNFFADSAGKFAWKGTNGFKRTFDGTANTADRIYTLPDANSSFPIFSQFITFTGPTTARTITFPDANFTAARTDAGQTFTGTQAFGAVTATTVNGNTLTTGTYTLTGTAGKTLTFNNSLTFAGTDGVTMTAPAASSGINGTLYVLGSGTGVGNVSTGETDLATTSVPAGALSADNKGLEYACAGSFANNANLKTVKVYFGSTVIATPASSATNTGAWAAFGYIIRTSTTSQVTWTRTGQTNGSNESANSNTITTPAETISGAITFKVTGQSNTASNDVLLKVCTLKILN